MSFWVNNNNNNNKKKTEVVVDVPYGFCRHHRCCCCFFVYFFVCSLGRRVSHIFRLEFHLSEREDINLRSVGFIFCIVSSQVF